MPRRTAKKIKEEQYCQKFEVTRSPLTDTHIHTLTCPCIYFFDTVYISEFAVSDVGRTSSDCMSAHVVGTMWIQQNIQEKSLKSPRLFVLPRLSFSFFSFSKSSTDFSYRRYRKSLVSSLSATPP